MATLPSSLDVGGHDHASARPSRRTGRPLPAPLRIALPILIGGAVAAAIAVAVGDDGPLATIVAAAITAAAVAALGPASGGLLQPVSRWGRDVCRLGIAVAVGAMVIAIVAQAAAWTLGAAQGLAIAAGGIATAALVGRGVQRSGAGPTRVLVLGSGSIAVHLATSIARGRRGQVVGLVDDHRLPMHPATSFPVLGDLDRLGAIIAEHDIDLVAVSFLGTDEVELSASVQAARAAGAQVAVVSRLFEGLEGELRLGRIEGFPVVVPRPRASLRLDAVASRATDIVLASILLVLTAPLWLALSIAILLDSPGGVLYRARRIGRHGEPFAMLKFRKMRADAQGPALTLADDDRFTRMGKFLARSKMDELPQLVNVLRGEMSFVGPRPEDERYVRAQADAYAHILTVRPGITGLNQIGFRREFEHFVGPDFEEHYLTELLPFKLSIDRYYVDHRSWWTDMRILGWTARALVRGGEIDVDPLASHIAFRPAGVSAAQQANPGSTRR